MTTLMIVKTRNEMMTENYNCETKTFKQGDNIKTRSTWGGKIEFLLTMVGYAVGLGNVWRFPYLCYRNGGGAFLLPYALMLAVVGLPLFFMEVAIGQYASLGPISIWKLNPLFKGLGYAMVIVSWLISLYYNVIVSHVLYYLYSSFASELPWTSCDNEWNTDYCLISTIGTFANKTIDNSTVVKQLSVSTNTSRTPSEEFYKYKVLQQSDTIDDFGTIQWHLALALLVAWIIVYCVLIKGIRSLGKVVFISVPFPYIMLTVLFVRGITLPGAWDGIKYYLKPDFQRLLEPQVWSDAATQIFYSLGSCSGSLIVMASYNRFNNNCSKDTLIISLINCSTSIFAGFVIFSVLGFMAHEKGVDVKDVVQSGPGLAFVVYPEALSHMPVSPLWSVFFFLMMLTLGLSSEFTYVETVLSALSDEFPTVLRKRETNILFRTVCIVTTFLLGLPMVCNGGIYLLNIVDFSVGGFPLLIIGFLELIAISWIYGVHRFAKNITMMIGRKPGRYWTICWKFLSPLVIGATTILMVVMYKEPEMDGKIYPVWANGLTWLIALFPILVTPLWFLYKCIHTGACSYNELKENMKPLSSFKPAERQIYEEENILD